MKSDAQIKKEDYELSQVVMTSLKDNIWMRDKVRVKVENSWVTLSGSVTWGYESTSAANAIGHITGIKGITNNITLNPDNELKAAMDPSEKNLKSNNC